MMVNFTVMIGISTLDKVGESTQYSRLGAFQQKMVMVVHETGMINYDPKALFVFPDQCQKEFEIVRFSKNTLFAHPAIKAECYS